jgi:outer membrane protein OmpA-like peptidoglycan-associated protein
MYFRVPANFGEPAPISFPNIRTIPPPGLGEPTVQIVHPRPDIGDLVDYLDATVRARGRVTVPTQRVNFLVKLDPHDKPTWWKRLWEDPVKVFPSVRVTIELVEVGPTLFPFSNYELSALVSQGLQEYLLKLHSKNPSCGDFVTAIGGGFRITTQASIEKELGIDGQLDNLLKQAKITLPMSPADQQKHFWIVYATFPAEITKYLIPEGRVVLDEFEFDKSSLTKTHVGKIIAIARHSVAMAKSIAPPTIGLMGHTDARGIEKYNEGLGQRRASTVQEALRKAIDGISPGLSSQIKINTKSFGETKPLIRATTEAEHARNRRVEVLLPTPRPRCPRVPLRAVVQRALKLLPRLGSAEQAQRIRCLLGKVVQKGGDDRWVYGQLALEVYNNDLRLGTYPFSLLRDALSMETFGAAVPDAQILKNLELIDGRIIQGIGTVNELMGRLKLAASQGVPLIGKMKAMDALRAWMFERVKDDKSIYSCYRNV